MVKALHCLGCGGYAATLDCVKTDGPFVRIPVAIKQVALERRAAEKFEAAELRGLQTMVGRQHPNIVKYLGFFKGDEGSGRTRLSFVFERCPMAVPYLVEADTSERGFVVPVEGKLHQPPSIGCDLCSNPLRPVPLTPREARYISEQLLSAIEYLHAQKPPIIHRCVHCWLSSCVSCLYDLVYTPLHCSFKHRFAQKRRLSDTSEVALVDSHCM